jgi:hypothetical protein
MSSHRFAIFPILAQTTENPQIPPVAPQEVSGEQFWVLSSFGLLFILIVVALYSKWQLNKLTKAVNFEEFKNKDLKKKLKLALVTIRRMETNPDLVHARGFNLDYLRMRMDEEVFHYVIVNQIKMKVTQLIGEALRPSTDKNLAGIVAGGRQIDESFDVTYEVESQEGKWNQGILFRIRIKLTKLPTQSTSNTISQIIECIETFLAPGSDDNWQPAIQGHIVLMSWDQQARPTPMLVLEQSEEGNVSYRSNPNRTDVAVPMSHIVER